MNFNPGFVRMKDNGTEYSESKLKSTPIAMVAPELKQNADTDTEITKTCAVLGCDNSKDLAAEEFFRFPEDANFRQIWTDLTGRNNWTPTDFSYICIQHFSVDSFACNADNEMVLMSKAVPSLKLPKHVYEVEYIDQETLDYEDGDSEMETDYSEHEEEMKIEETSNIKPTVNGKPPSLSVSNKEERGHFKDKGVDINLLKLFTEVQMMQRQAVGLKDKLKYNMKIHNRQNRFLERIQRIIEMKKDVLSQKRKKKARILLSLQEKIKEDENGLVMAMPMQHTDDLKNFALSIYKYSPQAYTYVRNMLRTMLPSTDVLENWLSAGYSPRSLLTASNLVKVTAEQTETELSCTVSLR